MIKLLQSLYINKVLNKVYFDKAYTINILMEKTALFKQKIERKILPSKKKCYQNMTKFFIFSIVKTRPDIAFATFVISCYIKNLGHQHIETMKIIL